MRRLYVLNRDTFIFSPVRIIRNRIKLSFLPAKLPDPANYISNRCACGSAKPAIFFGCMRAASEQVGSDGVGDFAPKKNPKLARVAIQPSSETRDDVERISWKFLQRLKEKFYFSSSFYSFSNVFLMNFFPCFSFHNILSRIAT